MIPGTARSLLVAAVLIGAPVASTLGAQSTRDAANLTLGMTAGHTLGSRSFWAVPNQPVIAPGQQQDIFDVTRRLKGNLMFGVQATLFKSPNLGYTGEVTYLGLGTEDKCTLAQSTGYSINRLACEALNRESRSNSAALFMGGVVIRPWSRKLIQPFARVEGGFAAVSDNMISLTAYVGTAQNLVVPIYPSKGGLALRPAGMLAFGLSSYSGKGYQIRLEARNTWTLLTRVTGPNAGNGTAPPTGTIMRSLPSIMLGFDIVLEKSYGRRY